MKAGSVHCTHLRSDEVMEGVDVSQVPGLKEAFSTPTPRGAADPKQRDARTRWCLEAEQNHLSDQRPEGLALNYIYRPSIILHVLISKLVFCYFYFPANI